ncbi:MAG: recombinase family protein [Clostridia bacterium]|nr:recombinase family protein [Clostridia bacterium]
MWYQPTFAPEEVLIYLRKSRSDDPLLTVEEVLQKHESILNEWCERNMPGAIPEQNRFREVVSGETIEARPEMQRLLTLIESPKVKAILCVEVQRLSRGDLEDAGRLIKLLRYTNTAVITPYKTYDITDEYDRDFFERELKRGNEYLEYTKKIMNRGKILSVQQGNFIGSVPPYGFDKVWVQEGKRKCPTLAPNEKEAPVLQYIFEIADIENLGDTNIAHRLNDLGIKPRKGDYWTQNAIKSIIANPTYIGKVFWNRRETITTIENGEVIKTRPRKSLGDYILYDGKHPALVGEERFYRVQRRHVPRVTPKAKVRNPLAGLVFCQCGRAMSLRTYMKNGKERSPARLLCDNQSFCGVTSCLYNEMLDRVYDILKSTIADFEIRLQTEDKDATTRQLNHIKRLEEKLADLEKKEIAMWEKYTEEGMPKEIFDKLKEKTLFEKQSTLDALHEAKTTIPTAIDYQNIICRFQDALNLLKDPEASAAQKNNLLKACIKRIDYKRGKAIRLTKATSTEKLHTGGNWASPPIELDVELNLCPQLPT